MSTAPACFIFHFDSNPIDGLQLCIAGERASDKGTIVGAQKMGKIFRIYPKTSCAREELIIHGMDYNPYNSVDQQPFHRYWKNISARHNR